MISIIIPCFNVEGCIEDTISSVLRQDNQEWEIIAIDDGSTDGTLEKLKQLEKNDIRIHVFHKENGGVSSARNMGIDKAQGEWIYFLDGDDTIAENMVSSIYSVNQINDLIIFGFEHKKGGHKKQYPLPQKKHIFSDFLVNKKSIHISSIVFFKKFINDNNLYFEWNTHFGEDREFIVNSLKVHPSIEIINSYLFHYNYRENSAMTITKYTERKFTSILSCERIYDSLCHTSLANKAHAHLAFTITRHLKIMNNDKNVKTNLSNKLYQYVTKYLRGFHFYGFSKLELYTSLAGIAAYNRRLLNIFLRLI